MQFPYPHMDYRPRLGPFLLGPNTEPENGVYGGDFFSYAHLIPDNSIDLCFTDPVYWQIDDYRRLAEVCARVLKPDSACLVWSGIDLMPDVIDAMRPHLGWAWQLILQRVGGGNWGRTGTKKYDPCLWFEKGNSRLTMPRVWDFFQSSQWPKKHKLRWDKPPDCVSWWLKSFAGNGAIVLDPFTGSGTVPAVCKQLGRRYLAFEIDRDTAQLARQRVRDTQPPLFVLQPEQTRLPDPEIA